MRRHRMAMAVGGAAVALGVGVLVSPAYAGAGPNEGDRFALDGRTYGYVTFDNCPRACPSYAQARLPNGKQSERWMEVVTPTLGHNVELAYYGVDLLPDAPTAATMSGRVQAISRTNPDTGRAAQSVALNDKGAHALRQWAWVSQDNNGCYVATGGVYKNAFVFAVISSGDQTGVSVPCGGEAGWAVLAMQGLHDKAAHDPWHLRVR